MPCKFKLKCLFRCSCLLFSFSGLPHSFRRLYYSWTVVWAQSDKGNTQNWYEWDLNTKKKNNLHHTDTTYSWWKILKIHSCCFCANIKHIFLFFFAGLARFFHNGEELRKDAISLSIHKIRNILRWFEGQKQLHFYASSLLFVYEGSLHIANAKNRSEALTEHKHRQTEPENKSNTHLTNSNKKSSCGQVNCSSIYEAIHYIRKVNGFGSQSLHHQTKGMTADMETQSITVGERKSSDIEKEDSVEVRMIDFAHVFPSDRPDDGYMYGLRSLLFVLEQILQDGL